MQLNAFTSTLGRYFAELQRRKVLRVASAYVVGSWIILQVSLALQAAMNLPGGFSTVIVALLIIGLPIAIAISWLFEFTPDGIRRTLPAADGTLVKPQTTDLILAAALTLVVIVAVAQWLLPRSESSPTVLPTVAAPPEPASARVETPALGDKSIAVLPFANLSPDKENEYFADGLTEELLNLLAKIGDLKVISRTSSFSFKDTNTPLPEIAKQLGVRHILEGSVRADGDDLRVTAQLIDVTTDTNLWSETYDRKIENVFVLQNEIARSIAGALKVEVTLTQNGQEAPTNDLKAYRLFLKARELFVRRATGDLLESNEHYKRALVLDPRFAEAHAGLATNYVAMATLVGGASSIQLVSLAKESAMGALALKPNLARALGVMGSIARFNLDWRAAIDNFSRAATLDPSDSMALVSLSMTQAIVGKFEQARRLGEEAARVDPLYNPDLLELMAGLYALAQRDDRTLSKLATGMALAKDDIAGFGFAALAILAREKGDLSEAERNLRASMQAYGRNGPVAEATAQAIRSQSDFGEIERALRDLAVKDPTFNSEGPLFVIGDYGGFFDDLDARLARGDTASLWVWMCFAWRASGDDDGANRRFKALVQKIGLVNYWRQDGWSDRCGAKGEDDFECN